MSNNIFPEFYFILLFSFISFVIGYVFASYRKLDFTPYSDSEEELESEVSTPQENVHFPEEKPDYSSIIPPPISKISKKKDLRIKNNDDYLDLDDITPGTIRAYKTFDRKGEKPKKD